MGKAAKAKFYAIRRGFKTGIFTTSWDETRKLVDGFKGAVYKGFKSLKEAEAFMKNLGSDRFSKLNALNGSNSGQETALVTRTPESVALVVSKNQSKAIVAIGQEPLIVYTDGSCLGNGRNDAKAGYGVYFGRNDPRNECNRVSGSQTNNRGELYAVIRALELTRDHQTSVLIRSDSQYVRNGLQTWMPKWKLNGWRRAGGEVINLDFWKSLDFLYTERASKGLVKIEYVKAHAGHEGNEAADRLANAGAMKPLVVDNI